ncbi:MAG: molybdenum cofactor guanylyltransferase [Candidatus Brocadiia bacterium]
MKAAERKPSARSVLRPTWAAVLIGGRSSRMGFSKTLLRTGGGFVLERIVAAAGEVAREVVLVGEAPLPAGELSALQRLQDAPGVEGPLGGLLAALRSRPRTSWIVISCDAPFLSAGALRWLLAQAKPGDIAVVPHLDAPERPEPLIALYTPRARSLMEATARAGERSIRRILAGMKIRSPRVPEEFRRAFANVNTPEEWRRAQRKSEV